MEEVADDYREEASRKSLKRELIDRILEGDWRHGISLQQMAMVECQILADHPDSLKWVAFQLRRYQDSNIKSTKADEDAQLPRLHAPSLILALHQEIHSITKAHYHITRHESLPLTIIRVALFDTPYSDAGTTMRSDSILFSKSILLAFPDGAPFVFISLPNAQVSKAVESERSPLSFVLEAIPKAMSVPLERYEMRPTKLTARSLEALLAMRGVTRESGVSGGWSSYAFEDTQPRALEITINRLATKIGEDAFPEDEPDTEKSEKQGPRRQKRTFDHSDPTGHLPPQKQKRLKELASGRFGKVGTIHDKKALNNFNATINDPVQGAPDWRPSIRLNFQGSHVFAGLRRLAEAGVIDAKKMPSWMTGEAASSIGVVKDGRIAAWHDDPDD